MNKRRDLEADRRFLKFEWSNEQQFSDRAMEGWIDAIERAISAEAELNKLREAFCNSSVYQAIRHYQKQGLCEDNEYDELDNALKAVYGGAHS